MAPVRKKAVTTAYCSCAMELAAHPAGRPRWVKLWETTVSAVMQMNSIRPSAGVIEYRPFPVYQPNNQR